MKILRAFKGNIISGIDKKEILKCPFLSDHKKHNL